MTKVAMLNTSLARKIKRSQTDFSGPKAAQGRPAAPRTALTNAACDYQAVCQSDLGKGTAWRS